MTKAVVTGGAGFIGYHMSKLLLNKDYDVTIIDDFSDYYSPKLKRINSNDLSKMGAKIIEGSILNQNDLLKAIQEDCDVVFHFAAQPGVRYSTLNPEESLQINIEGTSHVLSVCRKRKIKKTVIASSSSVFGKIEYLPIDELHPKNPISYYGLSKLAVERLVEISKYLHDNSDISVVRPFTVIGARQRPDMALNSFVSCALNDQTIIIFGDGKQIRDWTHVSNIAEATHLMTIKPEAKNEDFNIGSGISTSVNDVLALIADITDKELNIDYKPYDKADVKDAVANIDKAKKMLDYKPQKSLKIAIEEFIEDYKLISQIEKT